MRPIRVVLGTLLLVTLTAVTPAAAPATGSATAPAMATAPASPTVLITGSSRGLGLEFAREYAALGWQVIATAREPAASAELRALAAAHGNVRLEQLDVVDAASVAALASRLHGVPIDVLLNNAGSVGGFEGQSFGRLAHAGFGPLMELNAHGPIRVSEALIANVRASRQKKIVAMSSLAGSLGLKGGGFPGGYWYKSSKAALDMLMLSLAEELRPEGITVACLSPGIVDTQGFAAQGRSVAGAVDIHTSVAGLIGVIERLTPADGGRFIRYNGDVQPW